MGPNASATGCSTITLQPTPGTRAIAANTLNGDGRLVAEAPPANEAPDRYRYDPMNPVQTIGGGDCCNGGIVVPGAFDQRGVEARDDVLVYTSAPLARPPQLWDRTSTSRNGTPITGSDRNAPAQSMDAWEPTAPPRGRQAEVWTPSAVSTVTGR